MSQRSRVPSGRHVSIQIAHSVTVITRPFRLFRPSAHDRVQSLPPGLFHSLLIPIRPHDLSLNEPRVEKKSYYLSILYQAEIVFNPQACKPRPQQRDCSSAYFGINIWIDSASGNG